MIVDELDHRPRDRQTVIRAGAAADLIEHDQTAWVAWLRILAVSSISTMKVLCPRGNIVLGADAGKDAVD